MHCTTVDGVQVPPVPPMKLQMFDRHCTDEVQVAPSGSFALQVGIVGTVVVSQYSVVSHRIVPEQGSPSCAGATHVGVAPVKLQ